MRSEKPKIVEVGKPHTKFLTLELIERILEDLKSMQAAAVSVKYALPAEAIENLQANAGSIDFRVRQQRALESLRKLEGKAK